MIQKEFLKRLMPTYNRLLSIRHCSTKLNIEELEQESAPVEIVDEEARAKEDAIEQKRNKSRLRLADRAILLDNNPYPEPAFWHHGTIRYLRRAYGRYGTASGVNPSICWPIEEELNESLEYERVKYPYTIPEMIAEANQKRKEKDERVLVRQAEIVKRMEKLEFWKQDLHARIAKKENEAKSARDRKERLIEEVKRHFGYTVDPRDDRFKEMLAKKEKEQKKELKEARRLAKEEKMVAKLLKKKEQNKVDDTATEHEKE